MNKLIAVAALATFGVIAGVAGTANASTAEVATGTIKAYATSYTASSNESIPVHHLQPGAQVDTYCFREGQVLNGNPYWFVIRKDGETAHVHRDAISAPPDLRHC